MFVCVISPPCVYSLVVTLLINDNYRVPRIRERERARGKHTHTHTHKHTHKERMGERGGKNEGVEEKYKLYIVTVTVVVSHFKL